MEQINFASMEVAVVGAPTSGKSALCCRIKNIDYSGWTKRRTSLFQKQATYQNRPLSVNFMLSPEPSKYASCVVVLLCFDLSREIGGELGRSIEQIVRVAPKNDIILVGCKSDAKRVIDESIIDRLLKRFVQIRRKFETSAQNNQGIDQLLSFLVENYTQEAYERKVEIDRKRRPPVGPICSLI